MKNLVVADPESFSLRHLNLGRTEFRGTSLRNLQFLDVDWYETQSTLRKKFRAHSRRMLYDEGIIRGWAIEPRPISLTNTSLADNIIGRRTTFNLSELEVLRSAYQRLCQNYEENQSRVEAEDFHYGEMEMHRRASKWRWFPFYWYNLYWALSGYGERPSRALGWLAAFLAIFTGSLAWAGLEILDPKYSAGFGNPFFYLLQKVTLQRPTWAEPISFWGKLVAGLSVLLIPGQAALFLLALRNRLGRRR